MVVLAMRQMEAASVLSEQRKDVADGAGARIVLLEVPRGWGRSTVLDWVAAAATPGHSDPVTFIFRIPGSDLAKGRGSQAAAICGLMADAATQHPLGLDRPANVTALGIGVGSLFVSGLDAQVALLLAELAVTAAGNRRDASETGQIGALARLARSVSRLSAQAAVLALVDDADDLDPD